MIYKSKISNKKASLIAGFFIHIILYVSQLNYSYKKDHHQTVFFNHSSLMDIFYYLTVGYDVGQLVDLQHSV